MNTWIGKEVGNERPDLEGTKLVLGAGQVVLIFFILGPTTVHRQYIIVHEAMNFCNYKNYVNYKKYFNE